jgi:hypothetical protein
MQHAAPPGAGRGGPLGLAACRRSSFAGRIKKSSRSLFTGRIDAASPKSTRRSASLLHFGHGPTGYWRFPDFAKATRLASIMSGSSRSYALQAVRLLLLPAADRL